MKPVRTSMVILLATLLICAVLPSVSTAGGTIVGLGQVHRIDLDAKTLMVGRHSFKMDFRTRLYDRDGRSIALDDLEERFDGDDARFEAYPGRTQMVLRSLSLLAGVEGR
jgi:hypothetical protein